MPPKRKSAWTWIKKDKEYIEMMEKYEENNDAFGKKRSKQQEVWREISLRVGMPANYCRRKWLAIKHNYLQLKYMIHIGRVTEDMVRKHVKTSKYLDGSLDFLDRYMFKIPETEISSSARNFFISAFGEFSCTQSGSSVESGISITHSKETFVNLGMDEAIKEVYRIDDDSNDVGFVEPDVLPDIQVSSSAKEEFVNLGMDQANRYRIDDDLNDKQSVAPDVFPIIQIKQEGPIGDNVVTNDTSNSILKDMLMSTKTEDSKSSKNSSKPRSENYCDLARFLVTYANTTLDKKKDEDCDLKQYMNDLAEVLCRRLVPEKRKYFLSQIDLVVSEILEGT